MLRAVLSIRESSLLAPAGPLWFRGYSLWTDEEGAPRMEALVRKFKTNRFVTGHTVQDRGQIRERFGGRLFLIDTGMLNGRFFPVDGRPRWSSSETRRYRYTSRLLDRQTENS